MQNINIPNAITSINEYAFNRCSSLVNVAIGDNVESIGSHAFAYCYNLKTVSLGSKVASIGEGAFVSCSRLHTVGMSQMLADIGDSAFQYCRCLRNFEFPVSLETIGEKAFYECISLLSVKIRTNVSSIGNNAFFGCEKLVEVYSCSSHINVHLDPNGYGSVGRYAEIIHTNINTPSVLEYVNNEMVFADINNVSYLLSYIDDNAETVVLPTREGGYKIYRRAFTGLGKLRSVTIPACVEELEYATFNDCHNLEYLSITSSTTSFSGHMVEECPNLEIFNYVGTMDEWLSMVFPTANYSPMHYANSFRINGETITTYTVPNKYTTINNYAFYNFDNLVSITIPSSVTKIGDGAFLDCSNLSSINIASNGLTNVGANVFAGTAISEFDIPTSLERIGDGMFADCYNLTGISIGSHIKSIGSGAFRNCNFKEVVMPSSVQYVGDGAFAGCAMLERLVISQLLSYTGVVVNNVVLGHIFGTTVQNTKQFAPVVQSYDQDNRSTYYIPLSLQEVTVLGGEIAYGAFDTCGWFDVTLGSGITAISDNAFDLDAPYVTLEGGVYYVGNWVIASNSSITSVTLKEGVVGIAKSAFRNSVITSVSTLDNVKHIGDYAFANSNKLRSISLGGSVLSIGESAFYGCTALTSVTIPSSVKSIGNRAFGACTKLAEISVDSGNTVYSSTDGNLYSNRGQTLIQYAIGKTATSFTLPTDVKVIGAYAFEDSTLTTVYIGSNLKAIEEYAFYYCTQLKSIALPDSCESIGEYAFFYCSRLQSVAFGSALELIEANAFKYCSQLEEASFKYSTDWVIETNPETSIAGEDTMDSATMADTLRTYSGYVFRKKD